MAVYNDITRQCHAKVGARLEPGRSKDGARWSNHLAVLTHVLDFHLPRVYCSDYSIDLPVYYLPKQGCMGCSATWGLFAQLGGNTYGRKAGLSLRGTKTEPTFFRAQSIIGSVSR